LPFARGVSVGCGNAKKEIRLLCEGLVQHFQLFELSDFCIQQGKELAADQRVSDRAEFILGDAFALATGKECFDFVHWNNSLHHMLDVEKAVEWSYRVCKKGGMFYMDDYVGPTRFQWSDRMLSIASAVRGTLPERYLVRHSHGKVDTLKQIARNLSSLPGSWNLHPRVLKRPSADSLRADDPSEAADSGRILDSVRKYFPNAEITLSGGAIYALALNDILENFDETEDRHLLDLLLIIDDLCADLGETHYATALAMK
jgi:SAM-dependent methyltransferase